MMLANLRLQRKGDAQGLASTGGTLSFQRPLRLPPRAANHNAEYEPFCAAVFDRLARDAPARLLSLIEQGIVSDPSDLTFAAESLGQAPPTEHLHAILHGLLRHPSPLVREGALYGLKGHGVAKALLEDVAQNDPSPGVRAVASAAIEDLGE